MIPSFRQFLHILSVSFLICLLSNGLRAKSKSSIFSLLNSGSYTELRFRMEQDLIIIPVIVNGVKEMNFILDTGTDSPVILNRKYIKDIALPLGKHMHFQGAGKQPEASGQVINAMSLQVADAYAGHIGGIVLDNNPLGNLRIGGIRIHGVIGASLFRSFAVEIDYQRQTLRLHQDQKFLDSEAYSAHPMFVSRGRPILPAKLKCNKQQYSVKLMIDTGSNGELLIYDQKTLDYGRLRVKEVGKGYCGSVSAASVQIESLTLAKQQLREVKAIFPAAHSYRAADNEIKDRVGTVGNGLLKHYRVAFDYAGGMLYVHDQAEESPYLEQFLADERR